MRIDSLFAKGRPVVSFEFFPPSTSQGRDALSRTLASLTPLRPRFVSVTCGAGGTTRRLTRDTLQWVRDATGVDSAPHLITPLPIVARVRKELCQVLRIGGAQNRWRRGLLVLDAVEFVVPQIENHRARRERPDLGNERSGS